MKYTFRAGFAALLFITLFSCRSAQVPVSTMRPNAFLRVGESSIFEYPGKTGADTPTGYTGAIAIDRKANTITLVTRAQVSVVGIDLYDDERAVVVLFSVLPDGSYQHIVKPADKDVKVGDVVLLWVAGNF